MIALKHLVLRTRTLLIGDCDDHKILKEIYKDNFPTFIVQ